MWELTNLCRFFRNRFALVIAISCLITASTEAARASQSEAVIFGKNFFVPNSASYAIDLEDLYYHYTNTCQDFISQICEDSAYENTSPLPEGYKKANPEEKVQLSMPRFADLMKPEDKPWKQLDFDVLTKEANDAIKFFVPYDVQVLMNSSPLVIQREWFNDMQKYISSYSKRSGYNLRKFYYDIHILIAANANTEGYDLPPRFALS